MSKRLTTAVVTAAIAAGMSLPATGLASGGGHHTTGNHYGYQHLAAAPTTGSKGLHRGKNKACPTPKKPKKDKGKSKGATHGHGKKCGIAS
jgi:hypothetical protein